MSFTWSPEHEPAPDPVSLRQWPLIILRALLLVLILVVGVLVSALIRLFEQPLCGAQRPVTPVITVLVCRICLGIIGLRVHAEGVRLSGPGAVVANHSSWLDIFVLNARKRVYFVSKSEVAGWPGIGLLARITGTVFIARDPLQAKQQLSIFEERLQAGHRLLFFPEGTSTDGLRVLPFKTTLFQSFVGPTLRDRMVIQPVTLIYTAPVSRNPAFYGWWGDMSFGGHLLKILAAWHQGEVKVIYHDPVKAGDFPNRKLLARHLEAIVRAGMPPERQGGADAMEAHRVSDKRGA